MHMKVDSKEHLQHIIYDTFKNTDCVIKINHGYITDVIFTSTKISDNEVLVSICCSDESIGNLISSKKQLFEWIQEITNYFDDFDYDNAIVDITIKEDETIEEFIDENTPCEVSLDGYYDIIDYKDQYLTIHNKMRILQKPIEIETFEEARRLFMKFLKSDKCNKIIFSFSINIPDLDHMFTIDLVIDKLYVYGRTLIGFVITRPDMVVQNIDYPDPSDTIHEFINNKYSIKELISIFHDKLINCFYRCTLLSQEDININVYSNCKLNS